MTLVFDNVKPLLKAGVDETFASARLEAAAEQIAQYVGVKTVAKWTAIPASANLAAAKLLSHWFEQEDHDEAMASETLSNASRSLKLGESGMPESVEAVLKPLRRIEAI